MFITPQELETHLYKENIEVISREDETILTAAIDAACEETYGYLGGYDREAIFSAEENKRNGLLLLFVKDIAVWHFVNLCNAGTDLALRQSRYERAVAWLRQVQKGEVTPRLPIIDHDGDGNPDSPGEYIYGSNPKRKQHF
jgi:phage gp36-like protein